MKNLNRYVLSGDCDRHCEWGFRMLEYVAWAAIVLACIVFGPAVLHVFRHVIYGW